MSRERQKGTAEETRIVAAWNRYFGSAIARRTAASSDYDVHVQVDAPNHDPIEVLSVRVDRGGALYTLREEDFLRLFFEGEHHRCQPVHIESKRYARSATAAIFEKKFGGTK